MSFGRIFDPFLWSRRVIVGVFLGVFGVGVPLWFSGFSAFASTVNPVSGALRIPSIGLNAPVTPVELSDGGLATPERLVGAYRNGEVIFTYGHSTGIFHNAHMLVKGAEIIYADGAAEERYIVSEVERIERDEVNMARLLTSSQKQLILMTCAGKRLADGDYTERLIVFAVPAAE